MSATRRTGPRARVNASSNSSASSANVVKARHRQHLRPRLRAPDSPPSDAQSSRSEDWPDGQAAWTVVLSSEQDVVPDEFRGMVDAFVGIYSKPRGGSGPLRQIVPPTGSRARGAVQRTALILSLVCGLVLESDLVSELRRQRGRAQ